jgi:hypothetical protein
MAIGAKQSNARSPREILPHESNAGHIVNSRWLARSSGMVHPARIVPVRFETSMGLALTSRAGL